MNKFINILNSWHHTPQYIIGIMTGTSLDGIDTALCRIHTIDTTITLELCEYMCYEYPSEIKKEIQFLLNEPSPISIYSHIHHELSRVYAQCVRQLCSSAKFDIQTISAIGIHGQTLWHDPQQQRCTLQAGNGEVLAKILSIPVVSDFRSADVALGGTGAPLVPIFDKEFFSSDTNTHIALNIGGMANITVLPPRHSATPVIACDTGPGNVLIDALCMKYYNVPFDKEGKYAHNGLLIQELLQELQNHPFYKTPLPKSTGREVFGQQYADFLCDSFSNHHPNNLIRTVTELTAWHITDHIQRLSDNPHTVIVAGGGKHNIFLMNRLQELLPQTLFCSSESFGINADAKEAMCFAYLSYRTLSGLPSNIPSVTGASREAVLGSISLP
jgi:anhydro-N-acetylmuramic acid kinase